MPVGVMQAETFAGRAVTEPGVTIRAWTWRFGDGARATGRTALHTYRTTGTFTVTLVARDSLGDLAVVHRAVSVTPIISIVEPVTIGEGDAILPPVAVAIDEVIGVTDSGTENPLSPVAIDVTESISSKDTGP
jgi:PKD repeat protein